jgi:hypothetical protein
MQKTSDYKVIFEHLDAAVAVGVVQMSTSEDYSAYAEIAELARLAEALKDPEPLSFTIG